MAFRILTNRDLSVEDLKNIVASSQGNGRRIKTTRNKNCAPRHFLIRFFYLFGLEDASVTFDQFCCILTEFRNLPADKTSSEEQERRLWDVLVGKAGALLYAVVSPVSRILCRPSSSSGAKTNSPAGAVANHLGAPTAALARSDSSSSSSPESTVGGPRDIYLGGSCGATNWRETIAIPLLK